jgi:hypothetical protein
MISLIGTGIKGFTQLTLEGLATLWRADRILTFSPGHSFFREQGFSAMEDLSALYADGARDEENYARLIRRIEGAALECAQVAVLLPGHPRKAIDDAGTPAEPWLERSAHRFLDELEWYAEALRTRRAQGSPY